MYRLAIIFATFFGSGFLKPAPGSWGSLAAFLFASLFLWYEIPFFIFYLLTIFVALIGLWSSSIVEKKIKQKDPSEIVIDEASGLYLALSLLIYVGCSELLWWIICLILFRIFDILKPPPIHMLQNLPSGLGIMADDWLAGLFAGCISILLWLNF
ncbi:MAG: phosphatidylglycerophosphatase A [Pseudomonadota bacterium]